MSKLMEIEGRLIQISYKTIEINGEPVIIQNEVKVLKQFDAAGSEQQKNQKQRKREQLTTPEQKT